MIEDRPHRYLPCESIRSDRIPEVSLHARQQSFPGEELRVAKIGILKIHSPGCVNGSPQARFYKIPGCEQRRYRGQQPLRRGWRKPLPPVVV